MHLALPTDCLQQLMRMAAYVQQNHTAHAHVCQHCLSRRSDLRGFFRCSSRRNQPCRMGYSSNRAMRRLVSRERRRQLGREGDRASASEAPRSSRGRKQLACAKMQSSDAHCTTPVALVLHHAKNEPTSYHGGCGYQRILSPVRICLCV